ncbi:MAG: glycosyltransferase family 10 domain-containing protein [Limisphaerales bacterium]
MKPIRLDICDFWNDFRKDKNFFVEALSRRYQVELHDKPDFLIYADCGYQHRIYTCPRIFFNGEKRLPNWRECDYALTCHHLNDPRHFRLPLYPIYFGGEHLVKAPDEAERVLAEKTKFCAFVIGHRHARKRIEFFEKLSRYKRVDSGGYYLNNIGRSIGATEADKLAFLRPYKFNICFENESLAGYTTEKIVQAMQARCVPIYWGDPRIQEEFNPRSFLNYFDFPSEEALIERIIQLDQDDALYLETLRQPFFHNNTPNEVYRAEKLLDFFEKIVTTKIRPVGTRRKFFQVGRWILVKKQRVYTPAIWAAERPAPSRDASPPPGQTQAPQTSEPLSDPDRKQSG